MNLKRKLVTLVNVIADEAARNPEFGDRIEAALAPMPSPSKASAKSVTRKAGEHKTGEHRKGGRRNPAVVDPIELVKNGESELRAQLSLLDLEKLLDIVAQYGMDPGKLVMKWKDRERIIDRIVEVATGRATKGDAFRKD